MKGHPPLLCDVLDVLAGGVVGVVPGVGTHALLSGGSCRGEFGNSLRCRNVVCVRGSRIDDLKKEESEITSTSSVSIVPARMVVALMATGAAGRAIRMGVPTMAARACKIQMTENAKDVREPPREDDGASEWRTSPMARPS